MTPEEKARLAEIEAREQAATPGPWEVEGPGTDTYRPGGKCDGIRTLAAAAECSGRDREYWPSIVVADSGVYPPCLLDAEFIVGAREDVPWLIARWRAAETDAKLAESQSRYLLNRAEQAEIERNQARGLLTVETALREAREIERNEARAQLAAAARVLRELGVKLMEAFTDLDGTEVGAGLIAENSEVENCDSPEALAAFAVVAPLLEGK